MIRSVNSQHKVSTYFFLPFPVKVFIASRRTDKSNWFFFLLSKIVTQWFLYLSPSYVLSTWWVSSFTSPCQEKITVTIGRRILSRNIPKELRSPAQYRCLPRAPAGFFSSGSWMGEGGFWWIYIVWTWIITTWLRTFGRKTRDCEHSRENRAWEAQICNWGNCAVISGSLWYHLRSGLLSFIPRYLSPGFCVIRTCQIYFLLIVLSEGDVYKTLQSFFKVFILNTSRLGNWRTLHL